MESGFGRRLPFRFTIAVKIVIGYAAMLVFLAAALLTVSRTIDRLQQEIDAVTGRDLNIQVLTYQIDKSVFDMDAALREHVSTGGEGAGRAYESAAGTWKRSEEQLRSLLAAEPEQLSRLSSVAGSVGQWMSGAEARMAQPSPALSLDELRAALFGESAQKQMDGMREQLSRLRQAEKYMMDERIGALAERNDRLQRLLFAMLGGLVAFAALFAWLVSRHVTQNIRKVTSAVSEIAGGGRRSYPAHRGQDVGRDARIGDGDQCAACLAPDDDRRRSGPCRPAVGGRRANSTGDGWRVGCQRAGRQRGSARSVRHRAAGGAGGGDYRRDDGDGRGARTCFGHGARGGGFGRAHAGRG
ncbi:CHASE3 domain-containing protein [Cohnella rhizosphaerae]|uniref:CHASE3 domain-containing protein n=1 Tax=Cohnella rhizosphaerae TaxID=1457232 RepID=A0A9X4L0E7_9BACL|nr:CHASE3 domain-containing protein [Cohnella rhizosphaerae]MDG0814560.1 CHASE3 domain-containing protein [Cohnella rhizosphaerae]